MVDKYYAKATMLSSAGVTMRGDYFRTCQSLIESALFFALSVQKNLIFDMKKGFVQVL